MIFQKTKAQFLGVYYDAVKDRWPVRRYRLYGIIWTTVCSFNTMDEALEYVRSNTQSSFEKPVVSSPKERRDQARKTREWMEGK